MQLDITVYDFAHVFVAHLCLALHIYMYQECAGGCHNCYWTFVCCFAHVVVTDLCLMLHLYVYRESAGGCCNCCWTLKCVVLHIQLLRTCDWHCTFTYIGTAHLRNGTAHLRIPRMRRRPLHFTALGRHSRASAASTPRRVHG